VNELLLVQLRGVRRRERTLQRISHKRADHG
jgi:hypothetical protein